MIIERYLAKEVVITLTALTSILLLIFLSNQFVHYLARAADGSLPGMIVFQLLMLEVPNLLGFLLPLGLYMAILVAYGRLYAESEMIILQASGFTQKQLIANVMALALITALITGALMIWANPVIAHDRQQLIKGGGVAALIQAIIPQRIQAIEKGQRVFYVDHMSRDHKDAEGIFLAQREKTPNKKGEAVWSLVWADKGFSEEDKQGGQFVTLQKGQEYKGAPGSADFQMIAFEKYQVRLPSQDDTAYKNDMGTVPTAQLWPLNNKDLRKASELQWRLSVPIMVFILALLAIPLSKVDPRRGKLAKILPAIILYIVYANLMFIARDWMVAGWVPSWLGLWWVHGLILILALFLLIRENKRR